MFAYKSLNTDMYTDDQKQLFSEYEAGFGGSVECHSVPSTFKKDSSQILVKSAQILVIAKLVQEKYG